MCPKEWRFWGKICSKMANSGLKVVGAKSGDFGTLKWRSRKNKIGGPGTKRGTDNMVEHGGNGGLWTCGLWFTGSGSGRLD